MAKVKADIADLELQLKDTQEKMRDYLEELGV